MQSPRDDRQHCRIVTVKQLPRIPGYGWITDPGLRHQLFNSKSRVDSRGGVIPGNGLEEAGAIIRIGRKLLIDLDRYDSWLDRHRVVPRVRRGKSRR